MEGEAEEPTLAAARDQRAHVEKGSREQLGAIVDADAARLFDDEQAPRSVSGVDGADARSETGGDRFEPERDLRRGTAGHASAVARMRTASAMRCSGFAALTGR